MPVNQHHMEFFNKIKRALGISNNINDKNNKTISNPFIDSESIAALSLACIKLDDNLGLKSTGKCGIFVKSVNYETFIQMKEHVDKFLKNVIDKKNTNFDITFDSKIDNYGYLWFIIKGKSIEEIVAVINAIGDIIHEKGFSRQLLANIFEFSSGYGTTRNGVVNNNQYLIYNYKLDKFYPFIPFSLSSDSKKRDHDQEFKIKKEISDTIKIEENPSLWYPIWNIPF
jgi:hypothetical protein